MINELDHLSYSSVSLYLECSRKWAYKYLEHVPSAGSPALAFGSALHGTVQKFMIERHAGNELDLTDTWTEQWAAAIEKDIDWGDSIPQQVANDGVRLVSAVRATLDQITPAVDAAGPVVERKIEVKVPGVPIPIIGYLDLLGSDGVLRDFKTASRAWSAGQVAEQSQPLVYLAAANQMNLVHLPGQFEHVVFVKTKMPQIQRLPSTHSLNEVLWMFRVISGVWEGIERGSFVPNPKACFAWGRQCEYFDRCRGRG